MSKDLELEDLSKNTQADYDADSDTSISHAPSLTEDAKDNTAATWSWAGALALWATVFILFPRVLLFAAEESQTLTPLESFLALHFGLFLAGTALALILNIPSVHPVPMREQRDPPTHPLLVPMSATALVSAFLSYNTRGTGGLPLLFSLCTGTIGIWGVWAITFAGTSLVSKKTGADKHTSAFIFGNKASASKRKKVWRRQQKPQGK
ncbi:hypothetical protein BV25DRAFT_1850723 [Artomyces pyxidatus]|uniref:Uncharacterized protein n=1 Tax=Artomyces pyxidatus TaxID=48021 RepID=A0ACB8TA29_9AGAM|nr:hypothetical protein BV25DRAFT_1850723 [Artomyces pyxidatus]